jgi:hypothetical protein
LKLRNFNALPTGTLFAYFVTQCRGGQFDGFKRPTEKRQVKRQVVFLTDARACGSKRARFARVSDGAVVVIINILYFRQSFQTDAAFRKKGGDASGGRTMGRKKERS